MLRGVDSVLISSENPKVLADFYKDKVGLKQTEEIEYGEAGETGIMFEVGNVSLAILPHSEIHGKNPNPARIMVNIEVDDAEAEAKRLADSGVKVIAEVYHIEGYGFVSTFEDPDGNYFQLVQVRAS